MSKVSEDTFSGLMKAPAMPGLIFAPGGRSMLFFGEEVREDGQAGLLSCRIAWHRFIGVPENGNDLRHTGNHSGAFQEICAKGGILIGK